MRALSGAGPAGAFFGAAFFVCAEPDRVKARRHRETVKKRFIDWVPPKDSAKFSHRKAETTKHKDTMCHEGLHFLSFPSRDFVFFVVKAIKLRHHRKPRNWSVLEPVFSGRHPERSRFSGGAKDLSRTKLPTAPPSNADSV
jgi:hypothetical protein